MLPPNPEKFLIICLGSSMYKHNGIVLMVGTAAIVMATTVTCEVRILHGAKN